MASESTALQQTKAQVDTELLLEQANVRFFTFNTEKSELRVSELPVKDKNVRLLNYQLYDYQVQSYKAIQEKKSPVETVSLMLKRKLNIQEIKPAH